MDIRAMAATAQAQVARAKRLRAELAEKAAREQELAEKGELVAEEPKTEPAPEVDAWTRMQG